MVLLVVGVGRWCELVWLAAFWDVVIVIAVITIVLVMGCCCCYPLLWLFIGDVNRQVVIVAFGSCSCRCCCVVVSVVVIVELVSVVAQPFNSRHVQTTKHVASKQQTANS